MGNEFVDYLNSMNNANSNNKNALAESQILNNYYDEIRIEREIGKRIYKTLFENDAKSIILTGHAGDGKTSILCQILNEIGYFEEGKKSLKQFELVKKEKSLFYVKDMSELDEKQQEENLIRFLQAPSKGVSAILIGNTGPLLNTFKRIINKEDIEGFENKFLDALDSDYKIDQEVELNLDKYRFDLVNIAKIDNTYFSSEILSKILNKELWSKCIECEKVNICPICSNCKMILENKKNVQNMLEKIYFWLVQTGSRLTIRQIVSHISYSITGNLSCSQISKMASSNNEILFEYAFPNLFFGYKGINLNNQSLNIKAIRELNKLCLDGKSLNKIDNKMFVKEDFSDFLDTSRNILDDTLNNNLLNLGLDSEENRSIRRSFRRFAILLLNNDELENEKIQTIFSYMYERYFNIVTKKEFSKKIKRDFENIIFKGLYKTFLGVYPKENIETLNITLKRNINEIQNVQLILGEFPKRDISVNIEEIKSEFLQESFKKFKLVLQIRNVKFELSHEILDYLNSIAEGVIFTNYNPNFTFGMSKLKSQLINEFKYENQDEEMFVIIIKKDKIDKLNIYKEENELIADISRG